MNSLTKKEVEESKWLTKITYMKSEIWIQIRGFLANCEESNLLVVMHCSTVHNQVREVFPKDIHEDSRPGLDSPSPGKNSNRTRFKPEKSGLENSNLF